MVDKKSDEFKLIKEYTDNTHAATHNWYRLSVEEVFRINRDGEETRFKPFKKLHNRQLLWHGSRKTNFGGILSQGLRIAPPEAPAVSLNHTAFNAKWGNLLFTSYWLYLMLLKD